MLMSAPTLYSVVNKARQEGATLDSSAQHAGTTDDLEDIRRDGDREVHLKRWWSSINNKDEAVKRECERELAKLPSKTQV